MRNQKLEEERVQSILDGLVEELKLDWLDIHVGFNTKNGEASDRTACETVTDWEYRQTSMNWCLPLTAAMSELELRRVVVHEVVHVLIAPMEMQIGNTVLANQLCELAVENVTRAMLEVLP